MFLAIGRVGEGVIALNLACGSHVFAVAQVLQTRGVSGAPAVGVVQHGVRPGRFVTLDEAFVLILAMGYVALDMPQCEQSVGDDQFVLLFSVLKPIDHGFFSSDAGKEVEIGFASLYAEFPDVVVEASAELILDDTLTLEHQFENLRGGLVLEDAPVRAQPGAGQLGLDQGMVIGTAEATLTLAEAADQAMYVPYGAFTLPDGEQHRFVEQVAEVDVVFEADQLQGQRKRLAECFLELE